jgi:ElaB/YqjD/DUF883 family membrane-anchored ribosome-binding protein
MELKDVREFVLQSNKREWYESAEITFPFLCSTGSVKKIGMTSIFDFVEKQISLFNSIGTDMPSTLNATKDYFQGIHRDILTFIRNNYQQNHQLDPQWRSLISSHQNNRVNLLGPSSPESKFLIELNKSYPAMGHGAHEYFTGQEIPKDKFGFAGALKAYEFSMDGGAKISRTAAEKGTLTKLSKQIQDSLDQSEKLLIGHLAISKSNVDEFSNQIDELKSKKDELFTSWFNESKEEFKNLSADIDSRRKELEKTYNEVFFLKEPAKYWKDRADDLSVDGKKYLKYLYMLIGIGAASLFVLLWQIPDGMLLDIFKGEASAIKWTLVYVTFISFLAFGIKTLSKLTYSTYHLKRDAEERHQLTYLYLSLVNEKKIEDNERHLVLQSLFSRADTGLLKEDSSPTMPGLVDTVFKSGK